MLAPVSPHVDHSLVSLVEATLRAHGVDLARIGMAWARAAPAVVLIPAFGLNALPAPVRGIFGVSLAVAIFPALSGLAPVGGPIWVSLLTEVMAGLPVAIAAAVPLWAATMAGGVADALRGMNDTTEAPTVEGAATPMGVAFSLLACALFFATGGPARVATALLAVSIEPDMALRASQDIVGGITIAVSLGAPLLAASIVVEVAGALVARAASPAQLQLLLAPLRALALLAVLGLVFGRLAEALAGILAHARI
jgi:flagellar biosynthesis protein FliR